MDYILEVQNLCKTYPDKNFMLNNISFGVNKGTIVGLVGKNGAGKSTTINTILNIINKDRGVIKLFGKEISDAEIDVRNDIAVVFDNINFNEELTPKKLEKVLSEVYKNWDKEAFYQLLSRFDIPYDKKIKTFSRGMTMKLSIGVALSHKARLLILDEATAGLDPVVREEILDIFLEFIEDENNAILLSSHISSDLEKVADYIVFIDNGTIILNETKDRLLYEYGIVRMKQKDFESLDKAEYIAFRKRGLQFEALVSNKKQFAKKYPDVVVDNTTIDEMLALLTKGEK
ncbi:MAG: ABC transporter ATP-binding protein [Lachnospiraceae bacterium]|nr:ABC transporter ATP-binding protein [Lachnospiraceae bacterium]